MNEAFNLALKNYRIIRQEFADGSYKFIVEQADTSLSEGWKRLWTNNFNSAADASRSIEIDINKTLKAQIIHQVEVPYEPAIVTTTTEVPFEAPVKSEQ